MEITPEQFSFVEHCLPRQRGNVSLSNLDVLNAVLYVAEHGCKWRGLPQRFGNWHTIYTRMNRWAKAGVLDRVVEQLQQTQIVRIRIEAVSLDSTSIKVHPDGTDAQKKSKLQRWWKKRRRYRFDLRASRFVRQRWCGQPPQPGGHSVLFPSPLVGEGARRADEGGGRSPRLRS